MTPWTAARRAPLSLQWLNLLQKWCFKYCSRMKTFSRLSSFAHPNSPFNPSKQTNLPLFLTTSFWVPVSKSCCHQPINSASHSTGTTARILKPTWSYLWRKTWSGGLPWQFLQCLRCACLPFLTELRSVPQQNYNRKSTFFPWCYFSRSSAKLGCWIFKIIFKDIQFWTSLLVL